MSDSRGIATNNASVSCQLPEFPEEALGSFCIPSALLDFKSIYTFTATAQSQTQTGTGRIEISFSPGTIPQLSIAYVHFWSGLFILQLRKGLK